MPPQKFEMWNDISFYYASGHEANFELESKRLPMLGKIMCTNLAHNFRWRMVSNSLIEQYLPQCNFSIVSGSGELVWCTVSGSNTKPRPSLSVVAEVGTWKYKAEGCGKTRDNLPAEEINGGCKKLETLPASIRFLGCF